MSVQLSSELDLALYFKLFVYHLNTRRRIDRLQLSVRSDSLLARFNDVVHSTAHNVDKHTRYLCSTLYAFLWFNGSCICHGVQWYVIYCIHLISEHYLVQKN